MRTIVTGQIGMHKKPYLDAVADLAGQRGGRIEVFHIGNLMYAEAPDIRSGPLKESSSQDRTEHTPEDLSAQETENLD